MTHTHVWLLAGKPSKPSRGPRSKHWSVPYKCRDCPARKRETVRSEFWELKAAGG